MFRAEWQNGLYIPHNHGMETTNLTHWGRVTDICVSELTTIGSDNGLSPNLRHAIIWTNAGILLIRALGTNFSAILSEIHIFSFNETQLKTSSAKWRPFRPDLNVITVQWPRKVKTRSLVIISPQCWALQRTFQPNARDPPRTRLNTTTSQFSLPSTGDPCIIHKKWTRRVRMQTQ